MVAEAPGTSWPLAGCGQDDEKMATALGCKVSIMYRLSRMARGCHCNITWVWWGRVRAQARTPDIGGGEEDQG